MLCPQREVEKAGAAAANTEAHCRSKQPRFDDVVQSSKLLLCHDILQPSCKHHHELESVASY